MQGANLPQDSNAMNSLPSQSLEIEDDLIFDLAEAILQKIRAGLPVDVGSECASHPSLLDRVCSLVRQGAALEGLESSVPAQGDVSASKAALRESKADSNRIGRYRLLRLIGRGASGDVFLAHDQELRRNVAMKVPSAKRFRSREDADRFLAEARAAASLDHPNIVPVYDVGRTKSGRVYIVSKYIDGCTLKSALRQESVKGDRAVRLVATLAMALHHAHQRRLVHRDIKPANILLEMPIFCPYIADFGLAVREGDVFRGAGSSGTLAYMSPEQARGEGHLVDSRSDIYSLGVVLYELVTGTRPFDGGAQSLFHQIANDEPPSPRLIDDSLAEELDRITLKCLSKRPSDRYATAKDLSDDLLALLQGKVESQRRGTRILPKGLRSFDGDDSDFFLELLPGPRDRGGLPDSISFWKRRLEDRDAARAFRVGLMYGPSGCGKSSLVKAGILPRLATDIRPVYIEATAQETEARALAGLRKVCPELPPDISLKESIARLRVAQSSRASRKVVLFVDQFEQWLFARNEYGVTELVDALRQCDGGNVQAVVMVRDDFWMAVSRLFRELDTPLLDGHNSASVDLFDLRHAHKVLVAFGRAYGCLPDDWGQVSAEQEKFLDDAIASLSTDGRVIAVRLALFSEMVKGKPWTSATLRSVGGISGVGAAYLEERFDSRTAPPLHRLHQQAIRGVLRALLPDDATTIRGHMRSSQDLLTASGCAHRPGDFRTLLRILDSELRLITPADPEGVYSVKGDGECAQLRGAEGRPSPQSNGLPCQLACFYQLTHDHLVPVLREWLTRKQRETRRGRAELKLAEHAARWSDKPVNRHLPSLLEYLSILGLTSRKGWSSLQQRMMAHAGRVHGVRMAVLSLLSVFLGYVGYEVDGRYRAQALVDRLLVANPDQIRPAIRELSRYARWARPLLHHELSLQPNSTSDRLRRLHSQIALVGNDPSLVIPISQSLLDPDIEVDYLGVLRDSLPLQQAEAKAEWWRLLQDSAKPAAMRFRAGVVLAGRDPSSVMWRNDDAQFLAMQLVSANPEFQPRLRELLAPISSRLLPPLAVIFSDPTQDNVRLMSAANAIAQYAGAERDVSLLGKLVSIATPEQYAVLYPVFAKQARSEVQEDLHNAIREQPDESLSGSERVTLGRRRAGAAITLLRLGGREESFDVLRVSNDPESLTQFVHGCRDRGLTPAQLLDLLDRADLGRRALKGEPRRMQDRVVFGLLLALGEFDLSEMPEVSRTVLVERIARWYRTEPSSALHGACGWLLRHWGQHDVARQVDRSPVPYAPDREWFTLEVPAPNGGSPESAGDIPKRSLFVTFVVIPAGEYLIGSATDEEGRQAGEARRNVTLTRPVAIADRELTWEQYDPIMGGDLREVSRSFWTREKPADDAPVIEVSWFDAAAYCRGLTTARGLSESQQSLENPEALEKDYQGLPRSWSMRLDAEGFRLPTESEWEVACRAGTSTAYAHGHDVSWLGRYAWFCDQPPGHVSSPQVNFEAWWERNPQEWSHRVGQLRPNLWGLLDMQGNLGEWCYDSYQQYHDHGYENGENDFTDPIGEDGYVSARVARGGRWYDASFRCRSACRMRIGPGYKQHDVGFRLALTLSAVASSSEYDQVKEVEAGAVGTAGAADEKYLEMP